MLFTEVAPPIAPGQQAVNLLASAERPGDEGAGRWMQGIAWRSDSCPQYQGFNPCVEQTELPELGSSGLHYYSPVGYRVRDECSTLGGRFDSDRIRRTADGIASYVVARELWTGELSALDPYDTPGGGSGLVNAHLASPDATTLPASTDLMQAVADLECAAREASRGLGPIFIHGPCRLLGRIGDRFRRVGNELRTFLDGIVVPDAGYPGTGPAGTGDNWLYATGPVAIRMSQVQLDDAPASTTIRQSNTRQMLASRIFSVAFDPCVHFAIQVTT